MLRIPKLVLFKMVDEKFSFFIFSHLSFSCQKGKKKEKRVKKTLWRKNPLWDTPKFIFHVTYVGHRRPSVKMQEERQGTHNTGIITAKIQPVLGCP